jgi:hypothetical protein
MKLSREQRDAELELRWANSWNRGDRIVRLFEVKHPRQIALLGEEWIVCDCFPDEMSLVLELLPCPALAAMTREEQRFLDALPDEIDVWRGCYRNNRWGYSWSTSREVAAKFPFYARYRQAGKPLLLRGAVDKDDVLFVKLGRDEYEVVPRPGSVRVLAEVPAREHLERAA